MQVDNIPYIYGFYGIDHIQIFFISHETTGAHNPPPCKGKLVHPNSSWMLTARPKQGFQHEPIGMIHDFHGMSCQGFERCQSLNLQRSARGVASDWMIYAHNTQCMVVDLPTWMVNFYGTCISALSVMRYMFFFFFLWCFKVHVWVAWNSKDWVHIEKNNENLVPKR